MNKLKIESLHDIVIPITECNTVHSMEEIIASMQAFKAALVKHHAELGNTTVTKKIVKEKPKMSEMTMAVSDTSTEETTQVTDKLPPTKYGRNEQGQALNKDGTVRKPRRDKGQSRAK